MTEPKIDDSRDPNPYPTREQAMRAEGAENRSEPPPWAPWAREAMEAMSEWIGREAYVDKSGSRPLETLWRIHDRITAPAEARAREAEQDRDRWQSESNAWEAEANHREQQADDAAEAARQAGREEGRRERDAQWACHLESAHANRWEMEAATEDDRAKLRHRSAAAAIRALAVDADEGLVDRHPTAPRGFCWWPCLAQRDRMAAAPTPLARTEQACREALAPEASPMGGTPDPAAKARQQALVRIAREAEFFEAHVRGCAELLGECNSDACPLCSTEWQDLQTAIEDAARIGAIPQAAHEPPAAPLPEPDAATELRVLIQTLWDTGGNHADAQGTRRRAALACVDLLATAAAAPSEPGRGWMEPDDAFAAWDRGDLSEDQASRMLGLDRVTARQALDDWRAAKATAATAPQGAGPVDEREQGRRDGLREAADEARLYAESDDIDDDEAREALRQLAADLDQEAGPELLALRAETSPTTGACMECGGRGRLMLDDEPEDETDDDGCVRCPWCKGTGKGSGGSWRTHAAAWLRFQAEGPSDITDRRLIRELATKLDGRDENEAPTYRALAAAYAAEHEEKPADLSDGESEALSFALHYLAPCRLSDAAAPSAPQAPSLEALAELAAEYRIAGDEWAAVRLETVAGIAAPPVEPQGAPQGGPAGALDMWREGWAAAIESACRWIDVVAREHADMDAATCRILTDRMEAGEVGRHVERKLARARAEAKARAPYGQAASPPHGEPARRSPNEVEAGLMRAVVQDTARLEALDEALDVELARYVAPGTCTHNEAMASLLTVQRILRRPSIDDTTRPSMAVASPEAIDEVLAEDLDEPAYAPKVGDEVTVTLRGKVSAADRFTARVMVDIERPGGTLAQWLDMHEVRPTSDEPGEVKP